MRPVSTADTGAATPRLLRRVRRDSSSAPLRRCLSKANSDCRRVSSSEAMRKRSIICRRSSLCRASSFSAASRPMRASFPSASSAASCCCKAAILAEASAFCAAKAALPSSTATCARWASASTRRSRASTVATSPRSCASVSRRWASTSSARARWASAWSRKSASCACASSALSRHESSDDCKPSSACFRSCTSWAALCSTFSRSAAKARSAASRASCSRLINASSSCTFVLKSSICALRWSSPARICASSAEIFWSRSRRSPSKRETSSSKDDLLFRSCSISTATRSCSARCSCSFASRVVRCSLCCPTSSCKSALFRSTVSYCCRVVTSSLCNDACRSELFWRSSPKERCKSSIACRWASRSCVNVASRFWQRCVDSS
mmetsp:Transcript_61095/g.177093  ORF Transcript_61095/g.177093 Transcript_61095/m.177093 type:complete len:380 (-) Transcript_61095:1998-3137(-)